MALQETTLVQASFEILFLIQKLVIKRAFFENFTKLDFIVPKLYERSLAALDIIVKVATVKK